jgi:hypothetical protein
LSASSFRERRESGDSLVRAQIDHFERARGEGRDEQAAALEINVQVVDAPGDAREVDRLSEHQ